MSAPWLLQFVIACAGIGVAAVVALTARRWSRRDPVLGYSFVVALLVASLLAPMAQWAVRGTGHAEAAPWRAWWRAAFLPTGGDANGSTLPTGRDVDAAPPSHGNDAPRGSERSTTPF